MWRAGKRGMYVDSVIAFAEICRAPGETVSSRMVSRDRHRMRACVIDVIDHDGRLDDDLGRRCRTWLGVPGFYWELAMHAVRWTGKILTLR
jgi:hypothetical protein